MNTTRKGTDLKIHLSWKQVIVLFSVLGYITIAEFCFVGLGIANDMFQPEDKVSLWDGITISSTWGVTVLDNFYRNGDALYPHWGNNETHYWGRSWTNSTWVYKERYDVVK